jgi:DNA invertase Pin-like site-specific DNA recombinase
MKAVGYIRVSTQEQAQEGVSVDAQRIALERYCELEELDLVTVYEDPGVSASKPLWERPSGKEMRARLEPGDINIVVAYKLDRLFRSARDCLATVEDLKDLGADFATVRDKIDTSSAQGRFFLTIQAAMAEMELNQIRERTQFAMDHLKAQGKRAGQLPFGWDLGPDGETLVESEEEQVTLAKIFELRESGLSYQATADWLNAHNVPTKNRDRKPKQVSPVAGKTQWHKTSVARMIYQDIGARVESAKAIIDAEEI